MPEHAVLGKKLEGVEVTHEVIQEAAVYSLLYIGVVVASSLAFMYMGYDGVDAAFEAASAQGNTGLTTGITSSSMPFWGKIILIFDMWVGRLEIIPVFVLVQSLFGIKLRAAGEKEA